MGKRESRGIRRRATPACERDPPALVHARGRLFSPMRAITMTATMAATIAPTTTPISDHSCVLSHQGVMTFTEARGLPAHARGRGMFASRLRAGCPPIAEVRVVFVGVMVKQEQDRAPLVRGSRRSTQAAAPGRCRAPTGGSVCRSRIRRASRSARGLPRPVDRTASGFCCSSCCWSGDSGLPSAFTRRLYGVPNSILTSWVFTPSSLLVRSTSLNSGAAAQSVRFASIGRAMIVAPAGVPRGCASGGIETGGFMPEVDRCAPEAYSYRQRCHFRRGGSHDRSTGPAGRITDGLTFGMRDRPDSHQTIESWLLPGSVSYTLLTPGFELPLEAGRFCFCPISCCRKAIYQRSSRP